MNENGSNDFAFQGLQFMVCGEHGLIGLCALSIVEMELENAFATVTVHRPETVEIIAVETQKLPAHALCHSAPV